MGSGKTTVGRLLARRSNRPFIDNDARLEEATHRTAREIGATDGMEALHDLEARCVLSALDEPVPSVIAAAASVVEDPAVRERLSRSATVVWLRAPVEELSARVRRAAHRPLARDIDEQLRQQERQRASLFDSTADITVDAGAPPDTVVDAVLSQLSPR
jgi:shikimate kinase